MYRVCCGIMAALAATGLASCRNEHGSAGSATPAAHLRTDAAAICDKNSVQLVLELPAEGGYFLNKSPFDSVSLRAWFQQRLRERPPVYRLVFVRADSSRVDELAWLVPTIEAGGGEAYAPDTHLRASHCGPTGSSACGLTIAEAAKRSAVARCARVSYIRLQLSSRR